ncbi:MAG: hypothetical protein BTN85_0098 [Candidatus Methanohalarchaeum thermophilum]|uniref:Uncharacterized protein n=1 Tax=Methanohalarchaeum thermophilum TaxID=1903181 RepID=A0A1Q6DTD0_METT1|nr:MAG: hypothetical protein BTN85_0098 [Candidatus Methanohalarchaeum thermophilum]
MITDNKELKTGELQPRNNISKKLQEKRKNQKQRTHRNTRYRKPKSNNKKRREEISG